MSVQNLSEASGDRVESPIRVVLLGGLASDAGMRFLEIKARTWREALIEARRRLPVLSRVIDDKGRPQPGYLVFVDGVDSRIARDGEAREIVILPVNHGGVETLELDWSDIERLSMEVVERIKKDGRRFDVIIGILRGGIIPARIIADMLLVDDIETLEVKFYTGIGVHGRRPYVRRPLIGDVHDRSILIVDDISDTGLTLETALNLVSLYGPRSIATATLLVKPWTKFIPDYYAATTDKWVIFPWEKVESSRELEKAEMRE